MRRYESLRRVIIVTLIAVLICSSTIYALLVFLEVGDTSQTLHSKNNLSSREEVGSSLNQFNINLPRRYRVLLDVSVPEIYAPNVWRLRDELGRSLNGSGVAIGIIDTGIDYRHPDFYFPNGTTKILAIWDHTVEGKPPKNFDYGYECDREEIEDGRCPETDTVGHGTHVASIAAGTGRAGPYTGVAPGAYLIVVKTGYPACNGTEWFIDEDKLIDGIHYVVEKAREFGIRLVINLSLGSDLGGHDGSSLLEKIIEKIVEEGVIVVVAAGNSADEQVHAMGFLEKGSVTEVKWYIPPMTRGFALSLWLDHGDEVNLTLKIPNNMEIPAPIINKSIDDVKINLVKNVYETGVEWFLELVSEQDLEGNGWSIKVESIKVGGSGVWHAWIDSDTCSGLGEKFLEGEDYIISSNYTISIPATSHRVISVGGYTTKNTWRNHLGEELKTSYRIGEILSFSSRGPTRDGRIKPEIVAPGSIIVAARPISDQYSRLDIDRYYTVKHGTSMSSPHVAGVVAIILQFLPDASYEDILTILKSSARWSVDFGERPNNVWGWGKLDARVVYEVGIRVEGLPKNTLTKIYINETEITAGVEKPIEKLFLKGRTQNIQALKIVEAGEGVRYVVVEESFIVKDEADISIRYSEEYYLEVESEISGKIFSGWYKPGVVVSLPTLNYVFPEGLQILFKPIYKMYGWIDEDGKILEGNSILVDKPHKIKALYREDYGLMYAGWIIISSSIILTIIIVLKWRSSRIKT
ncbi:MAG: S8 family peptidase [Aigarchaeota archaeon]|nr:S8 family peptidase [Aigarchaeota archaeon]